MAIDTNRPAPARRRRPARPAAGCENIRCGPCPSMMLMPSAAARPAGAAPCWRAVRRPGAPFPPETGCWARTGFESRGRAAARPPWPRSAATPARPEKARRRTKVLRQGPCRIRARGWRRCRPGCGPHSRRKAARARYSGLQSLHPSSETAAERASEGLLRVEFERARRASSAGTGPSPWTACKTRTAGRATAELGRSEWSQKGLGRAAQGRAAVAACRPGRMARQAGRLDIGPDLWVLAVRRVYERRKKGWLVTVGSQLFMDAVTQVTE